MKNFILISLGLLLISCGNYNRSTSPSGKNGGGVIKQTQIDFATIKREVLAPHCIKCHKGRHTAYANYQVVKASAFSMLARMETSNQAQLMPEGGPRLSKDKIALFKEWVEGGTPEFTADDKPQPKISSVGFNEVKEKVLKPYNCTKCHSQYNDYAVTYKALGNIVSLVESGAMPFPRKKGMQVAPVAEEDKKILKEWLEGGAPLVAGTPGPERVELPELEPTFESLRNQVLGPKCILCHNSFGNRGGGFSYESYFQLIKLMEKKPDMIKKGAKGDDYPGDLVATIDPDLFSFSEMPFNSPADDVQKMVASITPEELTMIKTWIALDLPLNSEDLPANIEEEIKPDEEQPETDEDINEEEEPTEMSQEQESL